MPGDFSLGISPETLRELAAKKNNVAQDSFDHRTYSELAAASAALRNLISRGKVSAAIPTFPELLQDIWAAFYKAAPELVPEERMDGLFAALNRPIVERVLEDSATAETRLTTVLDELSAGLAALAAGQKLLGEIEDRTELREAGEKLRQADGEREIMGNEEAAAALIDEAKQQIQQAAREVRRAVREALDAGQEKAEEVQQALAAWGIEPGDLAKVPLSERMDLVNRLLNDPRLRKAADMIGRFRNLARQRQRDRLKRPPDELHSITIGGDLQHVLPAELVALRHPRLRLDFLRRLQERRLLQYQMRTRETQGRGPIVCCVDCSGSMRGHPMMWAAAVTMGLVDTAVRQRRRTAVIFFNTRILVEEEFTPGERDAEKFITIATQDAAGGTSYVPPLARAVELISISAYRQADIVFITDGVCQLDDRFLNVFLAEKKRLRFRVWSVLIGDDPYGELRRWSDKVWAVGWLSDDVAGDIFQEVY